MELSLMYDHDTTKHTRVFEVANSRPIHDANMPFFHVRFENELGGFPSVSIRIRRAIKVCVIMTIAIIAVGLPYSGLSYAGCSDENFLEALEIYEDALQADSEAKKIKLFEHAFKACPSHGRFAEGYHLLGKSYLDLGQKEKAFKWLLQANRFRAVLLQRSMKDLAQTNLLLARLYKEKDNKEKTLVHLNVYKALADLSDTRAGREFLDNPEDLYDVIYTPGTIKEVLAPEGNIPVEYRSKLMRLEVFFDFDKSSLNSAARKRLDGIGKALQGDEFSGCSIVVEGHTDEQGDEAYNCYLAKIRAGAVVDYLRNHWKIQRLKLLPISLGKSNPAIPRQGHNRSRWDWIDKLNRRVVIWNLGANANEKDAITKQSGSKLPCDRGSNKLKY
jgi:outer membrane protein OmpA-like peptidoglycan-associated protein